MKHKDEHFYANLPASAAEYIRLLVKKVGYRKHVRAEVRDELISHFEDALTGITDPAEREKKAQQLIADFGDAKLLAALTRRAKKRCRPWWAKLFIHSLQAVGAVILYIIICSIPLFIGKPTIRHTYIEMLSATATKGNDPCENAQIYYDRAAKLLVKDSAGIMKLQSYWPGDFNETERIALAKWLEANKPAVYLVRKGTQKSDNWNLYDANFATNSKFTKTSNLLDKNAAYDQQINAIIENKLMLLGLQRQLAYVFQYRIRHELYIGDVNSAIDDFITFARFARHLQTNGLLPELLTGTAINAMATNSAFTILEHSTPDSDHLRLLQQVLEETVLLPSLAFDFSTERALWHDIVQRGFTDDGQGNGHLLIVGLPFAISKPNSFLINFFTMQNPDRKTTLYRIDSYFDNCQKLFAKTPAEAYLKYIVKRRPGLHSGYLKADSDVNSELKNLIRQAWEAKPNLIPYSGIMALDRAGRSYTMIVDIVWRSYTDRLAAITTVAIFRYKTERNAFPSDLAELVSKGYLKELPMDPFSDKPLIYKKTANGFTLYSVGRDFTDDGGSPGKQVWAETGDAVFWPVQN